ncbi:HAD domain-containing protein [Flavobacterium gelatinilyticum]|uniref:HAD domain-containing protein n=1 Tax=Flavobacterium gelatinilyticum TaxID=3003260 RepID=UPI002480956C|nr:HAD domain-containing protein [Flavobacterium gelatinilyticum]
MTILLDIDGVMVPASSWKRPEFLNDGFPAFSNIAVKALERIISETGASMILTTSHKSKYSISEWHEIFKLRGIKVSTIDRLSENSPELSRKEEILKWDFSKLNHKNFVIIDDDKSLNGLPVFLKDKLVLTSPLVGLTDELASQAISILIKED